MTAVTRERGGAAAAISPDGGRAAAPESDNGTDDEAGNGADDGKVFDDSEPGTPELAGADPAAAAGVKLAAGTAAVTVAVAVREVSNSRRIRFKSARRSDAC